jgi:hypothetical protein
MTLPALHLKEFKQVTIAIFGSITQVIHITHIKQRSSLRLSSQVQQLRIHQAHDFTIDLFSNNNTDNKKNVTIWNQGSIIVEDSKNVTFVIPSTSSEEYFWFQVIKDFQWLRKGIKSPNINVIKAEDIPSKDSSEISAVPVNVDGTEHQGENDDDDEEDEEDEL